MQVTSIFRKNIFILLIIFIISKLSLFLKIVFKEIYIMKKLAYNIIKKTINKFTNNVKKVMTYLLFLLTII